MEFSFLNILVCIYCWLHSRVRRLMRLMRPVQRRVQDVFSPAINYKENRTLFLSQPKQEILQNLPSCLFLTSHIRIEMHFRRHLHLKSCVFIVNLPAMQISAVDQTPGQSQTPWQQDTACTVNEIILDLLDCLFDGADRWPFLVVFELI